MKIDPDDPSAVARLTLVSTIDGIMLIGHEMTVAPSLVRLQLLSEAEILLAELRKLVQQRYGPEHKRLPGERDPYLFLLGAIDEFEAGLRWLASLGGGQITADRRDGKGDCSYCGSKITNYDNVIVCNECSKLYMPAKNKLVGGRGIGWDLTIE